MTPDLFSATKPVDFADRAVSPRRELGAYEALWARKNTWFKSIAEDFKAHPGAVPSDFVCGADIERYAGLALNVLHEAGVQQFGIRVHGAGGYPLKLRDAVHPIEVLYFQGLWDLVYTRCVAIVGTRGPSAEGTRQAAQLATSLVADGFTIVSGLARGIDTTAHEAAIAVRGLTIAVLGTPLSECYPPENRELQRKLANEHLVISQVPIVRYSRQHHRENRLFFPERNATMSALTEATVIVEAGDRSGALVQARHALKQGRKLFILDSCFRDTSVTWPAKFVEQGAVRVSQYGEIRNHLAPGDLPTAVAP